jgi:hypothetical protein
MSTIVIFGSNVGIIPLVQKLKGLVDKVLVLGHDQNQMGAKVADEFKKIDYRNLESIKFALSKEENIVGYVPGAHDLHYLAYSKYKDYLNGSKNEYENSFDLIHNKNKFRSFLNIIAPLHCPKYITLENFILNNPDNSFFPALFKPAHAGGGYGIIFISSLDDFKKKQHLLLDKMGIIEQFIEGLDYSISIWIKNGSLECFYADREVSEGNDFRISGSITSFNLIQRFNELNIPNKLVNIISKAGIYNGFVHCQIRMNEYGDWFLIEITQRLPGDCYPLVPEFFFGFPYSNLYLSAFIPDFFNQTSLNKNCILSNPRNDYYGRACLTSNIKLIEKAYSFFELHSHLMNITDSYKISLYSIPIDEDIDIMSNQFFLTQLIKDPSNEK